MKKFFCFLVVVLAACNQDTDAIAIEITTLASAIDDKEVVMGNVIACAASNEDSSVVSIFLYPREGATNISFYETTSADVDNGNFDGYIKGEASLVDVFNGYLLKYDVSPTAEKWVIVSFEEDGKLHLSNPIRLKHLSKPTEYLTQNVAVDLTSPEMPIFTWQDGSFDDNAIYFQVVTNAEGDLLSGTYTFDTFFQYYELDNVVLNITRETPPQLISSSSYGFTLMAVSEDNWVNLFSELQFPID